MANLIRSAKSTSDWTAGELIAYNITVVTQSPQVFFRGNTEPSLGDVDRSLINSTVDADSLTDSTSHYLASLNWATNASQECFINDFARETLRILGFAELDLVLITYFTIPLTICGDISCTAQTGVCLVTPQQLMILLVFQGDKSAFNSMTRPEPQVIAEAIAVYQYNNRRRQMAGLPTLEAMTIPCITIVDMRPTFYLVPVTQALSNAVVTSQYPENPTTVVKCVTFLGPNHQYSEGMETPEYRRVAFQHFVAFKSLAKEYWQTFLV
jgi:hypothetical protein